jgi:hypothetical protein
MFLYDNRLTVNNGVAVARRSLRQGKIGNILGIATIILGG